MNPSKPMTPDQQSKLEEMAREAVGSVSLDCSSSRRYMLITATLNALTKVHEEAIDREAVRDLEERFEVQLKRAENSLKLAVEALNEVLSSMTNRRFSVADQRRIQETISSIQSAHD